MAFDFGNANEAQRSAISTIDGPLLIIAGPGTGKTYTLVKRIVYLITEKDVLNVKSKEFLKAVIADFWAKYGGKEYEGLAPKMAIFGAEIVEVRDEIRPVVEEVLSELGIPLDKILVNVGDEKITKSEDIRDFNNLDIVGTAGSKKQFILLVNKGREGWNCRSLFSVALFRSPKSKVFVLQATMRCLRKITDEQLTATVYLSKENMDILDDELKKNFRTSIEELVVKKDKKRKKVPVRVKEPPRTLRIRSMIYQDQVEVTQVMNELTYRHFIEDKAILLGKSLQVYAEIHLWMRVYRNLEIYYLK